MMPPPSPPSALQHPRCCHELQIGLALGYELPPSLRWLHVFTNISCPYFFAANRGTKPPAREVVFAITVVPVVHKDFLRHLLTSGRWLQALLIDWAIVIFTVL